MNENLNNSENNKGKTLDPEIKKMQNYVAGRNVPGLEEAVAEVEKEVPTTEGLNEYYKNLRTETNTAKDKLNTIKINLDKVKNEDPEHFDEGPTDEEVAGLVSDHGVLEERVKNLGEGINQLKEDRDKLQAIIDEAKANGTYYPKDDPKTNN